MTLSLKDLIETGRFGSVHLGMSREQVESFLGSPDILGGTSHRYHRPSISKYGDVELHFASGGDSLILIHLDDFDIPVGGRLVNFDPWIIRRSLTLSEAEEELSRSAIEYEVRDYEFEEDATSLETRVGVKLLFINGGKKLGAVSYYQSAI